MIYINTNLELIGQAVEIPENVNDSYAADFRREVEEMLLESITETVANALGSNYSDCNYELDSIFSHWQGGVHYRRYGSGLVAHDWAAANNHENAAAELIGDAIRKELGRLTDLQYREYESLEENDN